jgi:lysozyme
MARQIPEIAVKLIATFEGFSPIVYICAAGFKTLGYGHAVRKGEKWDDPKVIITEEEARELLRSDMNLAASSVERLIKVPLDDGEYSALVSFTFNLGGGALQRSTLRSKLNRFEYISAAGEFNKWVYGAGKKLPGLVRRREAEKLLFLRGTLLL